MITLTQREGSTLNIGPDIIKIHVFKSSVNSAIFDITLPTGRSVRVSGRPGKQFSIDGMVFILGATSEGACDLWVYVPWGIDIISDGRMAA